MEQRITITKRQHDRLVELNAAQVAAQNHVAMYTSGILDAHGLDTAQLRRTDCTDGVYSIVCEIPDAPPADAKAS